MAQHQDLYLQRCPRSEESGQCVPDQSAEPDHQPEDSPDSLSLAKRIRFPIGTGSTAGPSHSRTSPFCFIDPDQSGGCTEVLL